jgi:pimeloyl-ACP methyl ester carboxylesterase
MMRGMANCFAASGFPVVTFDMRGAGKSTGSATFTGMHEVKDVAAVCTFVRETLQHCVILVGSSAGISSFFEQYVVGQGSLMYGVSLSVALDSRQCRCPANTAKHAPKTMYSSIPYPLQQQCGSTLLAFF